MNHKVDAHETWFKFIIRKGAIKMTKRFKEIYTEGKINVKKIIRDNETGVLYMLHQAGNSAGLTVMVDRDGKPLLDKDYTP